MSSIRTVLCYGDSNTFGASVVPRPNGRYFLHERWTGVLASQLGASWRVIEEGLGSRTTVRDDPLEGELRNGKRYLLPCLLSHQPLHAVTLMLGTNDLKARFHASAADIATGIGELTEIVLQAAVGPDGSSPRILLIAPPPLRPEVSMHGELFAGGYEKSRELASTFAAMAAHLGVAFMDAGSVTGFSPVDGFHLDAEAHALLGGAIAARLQALCS
jgi:lysophospholipase L1-like esterase